MAEARLLCRLCTAGHAAQRLPAEAGSAAPRVARAAARHERSAKGHLGAYHGKLRSPLPGAGCAGHFASATSHRAKVPGRRGRECQPERAGPPGAPPPSGGAGPWAARHSNSYVASGEPTHQLNGAYSRTDAHPPHPGTGEAAPPAALYPAALLRGHTVGEQRTGACARLAVVDKRAIFGGLIKRPCGSGELTGTLRG